MGGGLARAGMGGSLESNLGKGLSAMRCGRAAESSVRLAMAQTAWSEVIIEHIRNFSSMEDAYLRERASDVRDLGTRVLGYLQQSQVTERQYPANTILVGEELAAPNLADVTVEKIVGMISVKGSRNSHMAILGRAMGIPTVMGAMDLPWRELDGSQVIVDGHQAWRRTGA